MPESTGSADIAMADPDATAEEAEAAVRGVLSGSVAILAFQQACKELPKSISVISKFLEALKPFTFSGTQKIADVRTQQSQESCHMPCFLVCCMLRSPVRGSTCAGRCHACCIVVKP